MSDLHNDWIEGGAQIAHPICNKCGLKFNEKWNNYDYECDAKGRYILEIKN